MSQTHPANNYSFRQSSLAIPQPTFGEAVALTLEPPRKVAYIMSRFPKITETFILYEMVAVEQTGVQVEVFPLQRERTKVMHPEAKSFVERAHFSPSLSWPVLRANLRYLRQKPGNYVETLRTLLQANWGSLRYFSGALAFFPKAVFFAEQMANGGIAHIHAHFASHPAAVAFVIHRLTGIPYSFTAHGSDLHRDQHMLREKVAEAAFVSPISNYNKAIIVEACQGEFAGKITVIHCGVDPDIFQPRSEATPYEQGEAPFMILCIGTLHEVKGQTYLIEACQHLQALGLNFKCCFVGDGPDLEILIRQATDLGLKDRVHFYGRLTQAEIAKLLRQADVLAAPSVPTRNGRREGIPIVLMEAMASGVPVVASNLSGIPELVQDEKSGLLVQPGHASGLAQALHKLYEDPALRQRFGQTGRQKIAEEFNLYKNATMLVGHFGLETKQ